MLVSLIFCLHIFVVGTIAWKDLSPFPSVVVYYSFI